MDEITILRFSSIDQIDSKEWDSIVDDNEILNSHAYQGAIERSKVNNFRYRYYMFYKQEKLIAHVSVGILAFGLDVMAQGALKYLVSFIKRIFPSFLVMKMVECGHPTALGNTFIVIDKKLLSDIIPLFDKELIRLAKEEKTSLIAIRDVYTSERRSFDTLLECGYRKVPNLANTFFSVYQKSFQEYLDDLVSKRRREIHHRLKVFKQMGCTVEKIYDFAGISDQLNTLWYGTCLRATEYQREILNSQYFRYLSDFLGQKSFILLCKKGEKPIGFTMLLDAGRTLISTYCGLDYSLNRSTYTYFVLFYKFIEEAIKMEKIWLELGITNYNPKIEVGAVPEPIYIYVKSISPLFNPVFAPLLRLMNSPPNFNKRNIFNNRYYERHVITDELTALIGSRSFLLRDISCEGLSLEGSTPLLKKNVSIKIEIPDGFSMIIKARVRNMEQIERDRWRIGFSIKWKNRDHLLLWYNLVQRYAFKLKQKQGIT